MTRVDCFLVGAPKCGTTALAATLAGIPKIAFSSPKEPHFFTTDLPEKVQKPTDVEGYHQRYFPAVKPPGTLWCDGSIWSMYSEVALPAIRAYNPRAKIIAVLRDPARAAFSLHQQQIFQRNEDILDFPAAWAMSERRFARLDAPATISVDPRELAYRQVFDFHAQLCRIFECFPVEQVLILQHRDLLENGEDTLRRVCAFLGVAAPSDARIRRVNETFYMGEGAMMRLMRSRAAIAAASGLKGLLGLKSLGIGRPSGRFRPAYGALVRADLSESLARLEQDFGLRFD